MFLCRILIIFFLLLSAKPVLAAVSINEIAWMGGVNSANHEWIELHNSGDTAVVVDGWKISDGMNLEINLVGSIAAHEYVVLERTSEDSSPAIAFLLYTGALVNTGVTLVMSDSSGGIVDQVTGGENWQNIGGDNTTKETAQYTTKGWVTDAATPAQVNGSGRSEVATTTNNNSTTNTTTVKKSSGSVTKSSTVNLKVNESQISLKPEVQTVAYVNQVIPFRVVGEIANKPTTNLISYEWNFGDSYVDTGREVKHFYRYPGNYVVTVYAKRDKATQISRHDITVLPVDFSITRNEEGDIQLHNDAPYDIDISGYKIRGTKEITLPPRSIMLSRATLTIEKERLSVNFDTLVTFYDAKENLVTSTNESHSLIAEEIVVAEEEVSGRVLGEEFVLPTTPETELVDFIFPETVEASELPETNLSEVSKDETATEVVATVEDNRYVYFAFIILLLAALTMILLSKRGGLKEK